MTKGQTDAPFFSQLKFTVPIQVSQNLGCNVPPLKMQSHVVLVNVLKSACVMKPFSWDREGQHASQNHMLFYVVSRFNPTMCHQMTHFWRDQTMQIYDKLAGISLCALVWLVLFFLRASVLLHEVAHL